ncbi:hypothetical protein BDV3_005660 [Batrachochytrium dendrobatidis]
MVALGYALIAASTGVRLGTPSKPGVALALSPDGSCGGSSGYRCDTVVTSAVPSSAPPSSAAPSPTGSHPVSPDVTSAASSSAAPSPTGSHPVSPDGTCGAKFGYQCDIASATSTSTSPAYVPPNPNLSAPIITTCKSPKQFALTFDDGPTTNVPAILDMLKTNNVKATFFVNGKNFADLALEPYISILRRAYTEGHQIASHTLTHPDLTSLNAAQMWTEMSQNDILIRNIIGKSPVYMRPPYGSINALVLSAMATWGYQVVTWNLDSGDWAHNNDSNMIAENDASYANDMAGHPIPATPFISLQHDFVINEINWALHVITKFKNLGYSFVTVGECLGVPASQWYR